MTSLSKLLLVTAAMFSLAGKCEVDDGKFWYNLNEVPTAPADKPFIMDYNSDGEIDVRDAIFVGKDRNFDGNLEHIQIYRFRGFTLYKNGQHRYVDFKIMPQPDEQWFDMNGDGTYDSKIFNPDPSYVPEKKLPRKKTARRINVVDYETTEVDGTLVK